MSLARIKTWVAGEVLTASDLNSEFSNSLDNALAMISPLTGTLDVDGNQLTLDAAGNTTVVSSAAVSWNFTSGNKTGTPATTGSVVNYSAQTFTDNATAASGTAASYVGYAIQRPTLAASNATVTTTNAATVYIPNNVAAGTNETITNSWALWIDAGNVRFDDDVYWLSGTSFNGILAHNNTAARTYTFPDASITLVGGATQTEMETATSTTVCPTALTTLYHPGVAKAWGFVTISGGAPSLSLDFGIASITDTGAGQTTVTWDTAFSTANYCVNITSNYTVAGGTDIYSSSNKGTGSARADCAADNINFCISAYGDQ